MPKKLKVYQTSIGFYDLIIATPSMKAALEAWGAASNLFHQGLAREADNRAAIDAAMEKPGVVLRRPVGSQKAFSESADVPDDLPASKPPATRTAQRPSKRKNKSEDTATARRASAAYERQRKKDEADRKKAEEREAKARERREAATAKAQQQLDDARRAHDDAIASMDAERTALDKRIEAEEESWAKRRAKLESALKRDRN